METLQVLPTCAGSEVFYDTAPSSYPQYSGPGQSKFWAAPKTGISSDPVFNQGDQRPMGVAPGKNAVLPQDMERLEFVRHQTGLVVSKEKTESQTGRDNRSPGGRRDTRSDDDDKGDDSSSSPECGEGLSSPKETQVATTLKWLSENYELSDGVCLPRCVLYMHYLDLCKRQGFKPAGAATFGKLIRQKFKNITTRRLGTRGQSKYHYYGIGIKESSAYYQAVYTGKGLTRFSGIKIKTEGSCRKYSLSSKTGTLLPEFPDAHNLILPDPETVDKMNTFIMMYRTHSQRILDTVITANFEEVQNLLVHFWQGYPHHLLDVLRLPVMSDIVAICDSILYKVLTDVLVPNSIQDLPESLSSDLRSFLKSLPHWMQNSLDDLVPENIRDIKGEVVHQFIRSLTRQFAFIKMAQTARPQIAAGEVTSKALADLDNLDFDQLCVQTSFAVSDKTLVRCGKAREVFLELKSLLRKQAHIESYTEWIDSLIDQCVLQPAESGQAKLQERAGSFLLQWSLWGSLVMKELTLNQARSFAFLHVLKMTVDEYILLVMETQTDRLREGQLQQNLQRHMKTAGEIKMQSKMRTQSSRLQLSPKGRKRKPEVAIDSEDELQATDSDNRCPSFQTTNPATATYESNKSTASFPRSLNSSTTATEAPTAPNNLAPSPPSQRCDLLRSSVTGNHACLPLSPIRHYPAYDRPPYIPTFALNAYGHPGSLDYISHTGSLANSRQVPALVESASNQSYHPMNYPPTVNCTMAQASSYWPENRTHPHLSDPYTPLSYNSYHHTLDTYKNSPLLRTTVYQDSLPRPSAAFGGFSRSTVPCTARAAPPLDCLTRPSPSYDPHHHHHHRSTMYYPSDGLPVGSSFSVSCYGNSLMEVSPAGSQLPRQDGLIYPEDVFNSNMAAASGLSGFAKAYLPAGFS